MACGIGDISSGDTSETDFVMFQGHSVYPLMTD